MFLVLFISCYFQFIVIRCLFALKWNSSLCKIAIQEIKKCNNYEERKVLSKNNWYGNIDALEIIFNPKTYTFWTTESIEKYLKYKESIRKV